MSQQQMIMGSLVFPDADPRLIAKFIEYHYANPHIYDEFERLADAMRNAGRKAYSQWAIVNVIRWNHDLKTDAQDFKISNDYIALYPRLLIFRRPEFDGFFTLKPMKPRRRMATITKGHVRI